MSLEATLAYIRHHLKVAGYKQELSSPMTSCNASPTTLRASPTPEPTLTSTPDVGIPVPFTDDFDSGLRPEWKVIRGEPIGSQGQLGSTAGEGLTLELGTDKLTDYTIEFNPVGYMYDGASYIVGLGPEFRLANREGVGRAW
jgi:hypothetical protein